MKWRKSHNLAWGEVSNRIGRGLEVHGRASPRVNIRLGYTIGYFKPIPEVYWAQQFLRILVGLGLVLFRCRLLSRRERLRQYRGGSKLGSAFW